MLRTADTHNRQATGWSPSLLDWTDWRTRFLFFTGKGGVGKTTVACAVAVTLADAGRRTLLVSTDPASNLDDVLATTIGHAPTSVKKVARLQALNLDPAAAAAENSRLTPFSSERCGYQSAPVDGNEAAPSVAAARTESHVATHLAGERTAEVEAEASADVRGCLVARERFEKMFAELVGHSGTGVLNGHLRAVFTVDANNHLPFLTRMQQGVVDEIVEDAERASFFPTAITAGPPPGSIDPIAVPARSCSEKAEPFSAGVCDGSGVGRDRAHLSGLESHPWRR
jgi:Anion-transporting ATPase